MQTPAEELKKQDVGFKMGTARSILFSCKYQWRNLKQNPRNQQEIEALLENIHNKQTLRICYFSIKYNRAFEQFLNKPNHVCKIQYEWFRNTLQKLYTKQQIVPTEEKILSWCGPDAEYTLTDVHQDLIEHGFVFKKLINTKKGLIVENPRKVYKRMIYLNKVRNFRLLERNFVYIILREEFSMIVSPQPAMMFESSMQSGEDRSSNLFQFIERVFPSFPQSSVVVLDFFDLKDEFRSNSLPNQYSSKQQMRQWLYNHNMQYEANAHTAELYTLIQKFSNKFKETCKISDLLERHGFDVLRVPTELRPLSFFNPVFEQIKGWTHMSERQFFRTIFGKAELCFLEETLKKEEIRIYNEELELEKIIDSILQTAYRNVFSQKEYNFVGTYVKEAKPPYLILE